MTSHYVLGVPVDVTSKGKPVKSGNRLTFNQYKSVFNHVLHFRSWKTKDSKSYFHNNPCLPVRSTLCSFLEVFESLFSILRPFLDSLLLSVLDCFFVLCTPLRGRYCFSCPMLVCRSVSL